MSEWACDRIEELEEALKVAIALVEKGLVTDYGFNPEEGAKAKEQLEIIKKVLE